VAQVWPETYQRFTASKVNSQSSRIPDHILGLQGQLHISELSSFAQLPREKKLDPYVCAYNGGALVPAFSVLIFKFGLELENQRRSWDPP
jgi:hypothetical protein